MWEHEANVRGGKWVLVVKQPLRHTKLDSIWLSIVLAVIGNSFEDDDEITGVVVSLRRATTRGAGDKIALWTKTADDESKCMRIGRHFLQAVEMENERLAYQVHADSLTTHKKFGAEPYVLNNNSSG